VLFQPKGVPFAKKPPHPVHLARGHFTSPQQLIAECLNRFSRVPSNSRKGGKIIFGHETEPFIREMDFEKSGLTWDFNRWGPLEEFLAKNIPQKLFS
jgi:hypothetical protein